MTRILFVCHGNICRSPMAESVMKHLVAQAGRGTEFVIASAATHDEELGNPVYPPARRILAAHGIDCAGKYAQQLTPSDYEKWDYFIGMDQENLRYMRRILGADKAHKIHLLLDYTAQPRDVADPWYTRNFEETWDDIERGCRALLQSLPSPGF